MTRRPSPYLAHARHREQEIRRFLAETARCTVPGDGLPVIRARIAARRPWWRRILPARTNGAPAATGTPPTRKAEPIRKDTAMTHDLIDPSSPQGRQIAASKVLTHLLEKGLPDAEWSIDFAGFVRGQINAYRDDLAYEAINAYARFLGVPIKRDTGRDATAEWTGLRVARRFEEIPVVVWTHVGVHATNPYSPFGGVR